MHVLFAGVLACLDGYMNIAIEQTEEYVNGQLKNKYGDAFLRGNNGKRLPRNHIDSRISSFLCEKRNYFLYTVTQPQLLQVND